MLCAEYFKAVEADKRSVEQELEQAAKLAEAQRYVYILPSHSVSLRY